MKTVYTLFLCFLMAAGYSQEATTIYIIRHAEKAGNDKDSGLTEEGKKRAEQWADYFSDKNIEFFYVTPYTRAKETLMPILAKQPKSKTHVYDPNNLSLNAIAKHHIRNNVLIIGHSNTIAASINKLIGANKYSDIDESEFDNLYIIKISGDKISHEVQKI